MRTAPFAGPAHRALPARTGLARAAGVPPKRRATLRPWWASLTEVARHEFSPGDGVGEGV